MKILWLILFSGSCMAQTMVITSVTGQVKDASGNIYANCQWSVVFVGQNTNPGIVYAPQAVLNGQQGTCDSSGNLTVSLADNVQTITPTPSQWSFSICSASGYVGGPYCKSNILITITGNSQNITSTLTPVMPLLPQLGLNLSAPPAIGNVTPNTAKFTTVQCKSLETIKCVDGDNSQGWSGADLFAWINSAEAALPTCTPALGGSTYPCGTIYVFPPAAGTAPQVTTTLTVNSPMVRIIGVGSGVLSIGCVPSSAIDCIRWSTSPFNQQAGSELSGMSITGNGTAASCLHIGDVISLKLMDIYCKSFSNASVQDGLGGTGAVGLWVDNVNGFSERWQLDRISLDGNIINMKVTNSSTGCLAADDSFSYWAMSGQVNMRVYGGTTGVEIGPGVGAGHGNYQFQINGGTTNGNKTFFQMDGTSGSCNGSGSAAGAAAMNNINFSLMSEENSTGTDVLLNMASGTSLGGNCFIHNFPNGQTFSNTLNGTLACQNYFGPTGNQLTMDAHIFTSTAEQLNLVSDTATRDVNLGFGRNLSPTMDAFFCDVGTAGDCFTGSAQGDFGIRNSNSGNQIAFSIVAAPKLTINSSVVQAVPIQAGPPVPTLSGTGACATITTQVGGSWSGAFTCTGTTGASTITITPGVNATHGWSCSSSDITAGVSGSQSAYLIGSCTVKYATITANDILTFTATAF